MDTLTEKIERFQHDLLEWSRGNLRSFPWREEECSPYEILVAEMFLKQTRASTVGDVLPHFVEKYPNLQSLQSASESDIIEVIRPLGLYNHRTTALKEIGERLSESEIPSNEEDLRDLPQVGPYVANATLCFGFGEDVPIIDSNIRRIYRRLFSALDVEEMTEDELWSLAEEILPEAEVQRFNLALLDFGAAICTDSSPNCKICFASRYCDYYQGQITEEGEVVSSNE